MGRLAAFLITKPYILAMSGGILEFVLEDYLAPGSKGNRVRKRANSLCSEFLHLMLVSLILVGYARPCITLEMERLQVVMYAGLLMILCGEAIRKAAQACPNKRKCGFISKS